MSSLHWAVRERSYTHVCTQWLGALLHSDLLKHMHLCKMRLSPPRRCIFSIPLSFWARQHRFSVLVPSALAMYFVTFGGPARPWPFVRALETKPSPPAHKKATSPRNLPAPFSWRSLRVQSTKAQQNTDKKKWKKQKTAESHLVEKFYSEYEVFAVLSLL